MDPIKELVNSSSWVEGQAEWSRVSSFQPHTCTQQASFISKAAWYESPLGGGDDICITECWKRLRPRSWDGTISHTSLPLWYSHSSSERFRVIKLFMRQDKDLCVIPHDVLVEREIKLLISEPLPTQPVAEWAQRDVHVSAWKHTFMWSGGRRAGEQFPLQ